MQSIIAFRIAEQVADIAASEISPVIVPPAAVITCGFTGTCAGDIKAWNAMSMVRIHAYHIPHAIRVYLFIVDGGPQKINPFGFVRAIVFPRLAGFGDMMTGASNLVAGCRFRVTPNLSAISTSSTNNSVS